MEKLGFKVFTLKIIILPYWCNFPGGSLTFLSTSWADAGWRVFFNKLGNFNWLGKVRKTKLYHNTESVINRLDNIQISEN